MACLAFIKTMSSDPFSGDNRTIRNTNESDALDEAESSINYYTYRDYSQYPPDRSETALESLTTHTDTSIKSQRLPTKLNAMLSDPDCSHVISWMPHGRAWRILKPKLFVSQVLPKYFDSCNYGSFVRLVNAWGFRRFSSGPDRHAYYHEVSSYIFKLSTTSSSTKYFFSFFYEVCHTCTTGCDERFGRKMIPLLIKTMNQICTP